MTEQLYEGDSYLKEFDAKVVEVRNEGVILDRTAFYPRGGGQPGDKGNLVWRGQEFPVNDTRKDGDVILHTLSGSSLLRGSNIRGAIDWNTRYAHMRYHSAIHVICGVMYTLYNSHITGGQISVNRARVDFDVEELGPDRVLDVETMANKVVRKSRPIEARTIPKAEALAIPDLVRTKPGLALVQSLTYVRVVEIRDFDVQADGGTHVRNTKEVGPIKITKIENKGRHNKRIELGLK